MMVAMSTSANFAGIPKSRRSRCVIGPLVGVDAKEVNEIRR